MSVVRPFRGPIIDRAIFNEASGLGLPERFSTSVPYFDVIRDRDPLGPKWRFEYDFQKGGWVWKTKQTLKPVAKKGEGPDAG